MISTWPRVSTWPRETMECEVSQYKERHAHRIQLLGPTKHPRGPRWFPRLAQRGAEGDQPERGEDRESQPEAGVARGDFAVHLLFANRAANCPVDVFKLPADSAV